MVSPVKNQRVPQNAQLHIKEVKSSKDLSTLIKTAKQWQKVAARKANYYEKKYPNYWNVNGGIGSDKVFTAWSAKNTASSIQTALKEKKAIKKGDVVVFAAYDRQNHLQGITTVNMKGDHGHAKELETLLVNPESIALIGKKPIKGTGTALVKRVALKILKSKGKKELGVFSEQSSVGFYKKLGFVSDGSAHACSWVGMALDYRDMKKLCSKKA